MKNTLVISEFNTLLPGTPEGPALVSQMPLSFWGGVDVSTGRVQDVHHSLCGRSVAGKILCIPSDKGSCSGSGVLLEMIRRGTAPAGILCVEAEAVLAVGPLIGETMYGRGVALRTISKNDFALLRSGSIVSFREDSIAITGGETKEE